MCVFEDVFAHLWTHLAGILSPGRPKEFLFYWFRSLNSHLLHIFSGVYMHINESSELQFRARPAGGGVDQRDKTVREFDANHTKMNTVNTEILAAFQNLKVYI